MLRDIGVATYGLVVYLSGGRLVAFVQSVGWLERPVTSASLVQAILA